MFVSSGYHRLEITQSAPIKDCRSRFRKAWTVRQRVSLEIITQLGAVRNSFDKSAVLHLLTHAFASNPLLLVWDPGHPQQSTGVNLHQGSVHRALWLLAKTVTWEESTFISRLKIVPIYWQFHRIHTMEHTALLFLAFSLVDPHPPKCLRDGFLSGPCIKGSVLTEMM